MPRSSSLVGQPQGKVQALPHTSTPDCERRTSWLLRKEGWNSGSQVSTVCHVEMGGATEPQVGIQDESFITARPGHFEMQGQ
jgi:hypothetical protein